MIAEEPMTDVNTMADMLPDLDEEHNANGTSLEFCELIGPLNRDHCFLAIDATSTPSVQRQVLIGLHLSRLAQRSSNSRSLI